MTASEHCRGQHKEAATAGAGGMGEPTGRGRTPSANGAFASRTVQGYPEFIEFRTGSMFRDVSMSLWARIYPKFVSFLGSLGLGTAMTYLLGVGFFIWADNQAFADFFIAYGPWLVVLPAGLLIAHLYLRTHLGAWYLERGRSEEALAYTSERLDHGLLRGRKEALFHRLYCGRARIAKMDYGEALNTLTRGFAMPDSEPMEGRFRRWQMEAALRLEDGEMLQEASSAAERLEVGGSIRAALEACACEWAAISGETEAFERHLEEARWLESAARRVDFSEAVGSLQFATTDPERETGLDLLDRAQAEAQRQVPGRAGEICAMRAEFLAALGRNEQAGRALERADQLPADERSRRALDRISNKAELEEAREDDER